MRGKRAILLVEDDRVDVMTVERALKNNKITNRLDVAGNGEEALEYLRNKDIPQIILLDLNMPKMNGIEFLKVIKENEETRKIPVVVLTSSCEDRDKLDAFNFGAAGYILKGVDFLKFVEAVRTIDSYWTLSELAY